MSSKDLWQAIKDADVEAVKKIIAETPALINEPFADFANISVTLQDRERIITDTKPIHVAADFSYARDDPKYPARIEILNLILSNDQNDVNAQSKNGVTALHLASAKGHAAVVQRLIENNANLNVVDEQEFTPFHYALKSMNYYNALNGHRLGIRRHFMGAKCSADTPASDPLPPLHYAAETSNVEMLKTLAANGVDLNRVDTNGQTALQKAIKANNLSFANDLINRKAYITKDVAPMVTAIFGNTIVFDYSQYQLTTIKEAIANKNDKLIELIIKDGLDDKLLFALAAGDSSNPELSMIFNHLLDKGLDPNYVDSNGNTLIEILFFNNRKEGFDALLRKSAYMPLRMLKKHTDYDHANDQVTALKDAIKHNNNKIKTLIYSELSPNVLHAAVKVGANEVVRDLLVSKVVNINAKDLEGYSALHLSSNKEISEILLHHGADINTLNNKGESILHAVHDLELASLYVQKNINVFVKDNVGRTPFQRAMNKGRHEIALMLAKKFGKAIEVNNSSTHKINTNISADTIEELVSQGRDLMKAKQYSIAEERFASAITLYEKSKLDNPKLLVDLRYWHLKAKDLKTLAPSMIVPAALLDPIQQLTDRVADSNDSNRESLLKNLKQVEHNPFIKPFLTSMAYHFMFNDRATIRMMDQCAHKETPNPQTSGKYMNHSTVQVKNLSDNTILSERSQTGVLLHELTHYYLNITYHNRTLPYAPDQLERKADFDWTKKQVLLNIAEYLHKNSEPKPTFQMDTGKSSYAMGQQLSTFFYSSGVRDQILQKDPDMANVINRMLIIYDKQFYQENEEDEEFPVRLLQLIAEQPNDLAMQLLQPLMDYYNRYLIPDCIKANEAFASMANQLSQYSGPRHVIKSYDVALMSDEGTNNLKIQSWNVECFNAENARVKQQQYKEIINTVDHMLSEDSLDIITLQKVPSDIYRHIVASPNIDGKWGVCRRNELVTFYRRDKLALGTVEDYGLTQSMMFKMSEKNFRLTNSHAVKEHLSVIQGQLNHLYSQHINIDTVIIADIESIEDLGIDQNGEQNESLKDNTKCLVQRNNQIKFAQGATSLVTSQRSLNVLRDSNKVEYLPIIDSEIAMVNSEYTLAQITRHFKELDQNANVNLVLTQEKLHVLITSENQYPWLLRFKAQDNTYLIPADSTIFQQLHLGLEVNKSFSSSNTQDIKPLNEVEFFTELALRKAQAFEQYNKTKSKMLSIFRPKFYTARSKLHEIAIAEFNMELQHILLQFTKNNSAQTKSIKALQDCIKHISTIANTEKDIKDKLEKMSSYINESGNNINQEFKDCVKEQVDLLRQKLKDPEKMLKKRNR